MWTQYVSVLQSMTKSLRHQGQVQQFLQFVLKQVGHFVLLSLCFRFLSQGWEAAEAMPMTTVYKRLPVGEVEKWVLWTIYTPHYYTGLFLSDHAGFVKQIPVFISANIALLGKCIWVISHDIYILDWTCGHHSYFPYTRLDLWSSRSYFPYTTLDLQNYKSCVKICNQSTGVIVIVVISQMSRGR